VIFIWELVPMVKRYVLLILTCCRAYLVVGNLRDGLFGGSGVVRCFFNEI
jgi:hypothetical protein